MKKLFSIFIVFALILSLGAPIMASAANEPIGNLMSELGIAGELVITEVLSNTKCDNGGYTTGNDYCEFFEVMNISDKEIDLFDYKIWYNNNERGSYFYCDQAQWFLAPGEVGLVISFFTDHVTKVPVDGGPTGEPWVKYNADGTRTHNTKAWLDFARDAYLWGENIPEEKDLKVFLIDRTDNTGANSGNDYTIGSGFNLGNSGPITYYVSHRGDDFEKAYCSATVASASNNRSTTFGAPAKGSIELEVYEFDFGDPTPGYLNEDQLAQWTEAGAETETDPVVTTKEPDLTTAPPETEGTKDTDEPGNETDKVTENNNDTGKAETTAGKDEKKGCGGMISASAATFMLLSAALAPIMIKRKNKE